MHESLLVLGGVIVGTSFTCIGCYLGAHLVKRTYMEITHPYPEEVILKLDNEVQPQPLNKPEGYDWDEYDEYLKPPRDEDGGEPEA